MPYRVVSLVVILTVVLFCLTLTNNTLSAAPLSLEDCYRRAIAKRETLAQREADIEAAQARYDQAVAELFPRVTVNSNRRYRDNPSFGSLTRRGFSDPSTGLPPSRLLGKSQFEATITLSQPIFRGFREYALSRASAAEQASLNHQLNRDRQLVYLDVADLYFQQLLYQEQEAVLARVQRTLNQRVNELREFIQLGKSKESEQFAAEAEVAQQALAQEQIKKALAATREVLGSLLKTPANEIELSHIETPQNIPTIETFLHKIKERSDILARIELERMFSELISVEKRNWWPTLDLDLTSIQIDDPNRNRDWEAFVRMSIPIFDGGRISARIAEQRALLHRAETASAEQRRLAEQEIRVAYQNIIYAKNARIESQKLIKARQKSYNAQLNDYRAGRVTNLDVLTALTFLQQAELGQVELRFAEANDYARLLVASGEVNP